MKTMKQFAILGVSLFLGIGATASAQNEPMRCEDLTFAVAQAEGGAASDSIAATLCASGTINKKTIQILIHGATYDHHYWDFPYQPQTYSYARAMTSAGYAILNVDRVGYGASSHPTSGSSITLHTGAFNIHQ